MASAAVFNAVRTRLDANWSTTPVVYPNEVFTTPADGSAFVQVEFPVADEQQISIGAPGNNVFRDVGTIRLVINIAKGQGLTVANAYAGTLGSLFRGKDFDNVITYAPTPPVYLGVDGDYAAVSVAVPYYFDLVG